MEEKDKKILEYINSKLISFIMFTDAKMEDIETKDNLELLIMIDAYLTEYRTKMPEFSKKHILDFINKYRFDKSDKNFEKIFKVSNEIIDSVNISNDNDMATYIIEEGIKFYGIKDAVLMRMTHFAEMVDDVLNLESRVHRCLYSLYIISDEEFYEKDFSELCFDLDFINIINYIDSENPYILKNKTIRERVKSVLISNKELFDAKVILDENKNKINLKYERRKTNKLFKKFKER